MCRVFACGLGWWLIAGLLGYAEPATNSFLGQQSCSTSGCHGGAKRNESITWAKKDLHSRAYATLTTARSARIAETLHIGDATTAGRCTVCHAPMPAPYRAEGVSCESCHGGGEPWLRPHTRSDYTHAERVAAGMRELKPLPARANACVACHQNVDADILAAGHPELIFELDGQSVAMPKHWREAVGVTGAQAWRAGQEAALREIAWQLSRQPTEKLAAQREALAWLLNQCRADAEPATWVAALAGSSAAFGDAAVPRAVQARRAERLVLALDRLAPDAELGELFKLAQSLPDFDPVLFAAALRKFADSRRQK